ncbi:MAG TPA: endolytic transglycosylase MltG [Gammaproteobacteria bacterium]|nr:endolytic transglycosylase MltG [Gammaproteobacteria bacterium]
MKQTAYRFIALAIVTLSLGAGWLWWEYQVFLDAPLQGVAAEGELLEVEPGSNLTRLSQSLHARGWLRNPGYWLWYARWNGRGDIMVGEYRVTPEDTPRSLLTRLNEGKVAQYSLTVVEGWTFSQLREAIAGHPVLEETLTGLPDETVMAQLGRPGMHPEGRFLPDTYHFPRGTTDVAFLQRAMRAMDRVLAEEWEARAVGLPFRDPYEALILASIVEKETGVASERQLIAGVFVRRLTRRMRLQSDPTVIYGMGERYDGNIRRRDLLRDTPYNTYRRHGLPPTPIALPGRDAIRATLHPDEGDALYFVARGDGSHYFSSTLEEHNEAVIRFQLKGKRRAFSSYREPGQRN